MDKNYCGTKSMLHKPSTNNDQNDYGTQAMLCRPHPVMVNLHETYIQIMLYPFSSMETHENCQNLSSVLIVDYSCSISGPI